MIPATMNWTTVSVKASRPSESFAVNAMCRARNAADTMVMISPNPSDIVSNPSENETKPTPATQSTTAAMLYRVGRMRETAQAKNGTNAQ